MAPKFTIFGTGFLVAGHTVLTNRHVANKLLAYVAQEHLPRNSRCVAFLRPDAPDGKGINQSFYPIVGFVLATAPTTDDLALVRFETDGNDPVDSLSPMPLADRFPATVGDPVLVYGYAYGTSLLKRPNGEADQIYRFGPVLHHGYVSAIAPFDHSAHVARVLLDVRTVVGMSGSPIFDPATGTVIAIHDAGCDNTVAFGIPITSESIAAFVSATRGASIGDEGTAEMPRVFTE